MSGEQHIHIMFIEYTVSQKNTCYLTFIHKFVNISPGRVATGLRGGENDDHFIMYNGAGLQLSKPNVHWGPFLI